MTIASTTIPVVTSPPITDLLAEAFRAGVSVRLTAGDRLALRYVPTEITLRCAAALRARQGEVLQVLRQRQLDVFHRLAARAQQRPVRTFPARPRAFRSGRRGR